MPDLVACPYCNGAGKLTITANEIGAPPREVELPCTYCRGAKQVSEPDAARIKRNMNAWCKCQTILASDIVTDWFGNRYVQTHLICDKVAGTG